MSKQFKRLLLIVMLVVCFSMQLGTEARAGFPTFFNFSPPYYCGSICIDCILKKLGNVTKNVTAATALMKDINVSYVTENPAGNAATAKGTVFLGETTAGVTVEIDPNIVEKNGTAELTLTIPDSELLKIETALEELILPNPQWDILAYNILSFTLRLELTRELEPQHIIEALCTWNDDTGEFDVVVICDSQDGPDCPA